MLGLGSGEVVVQTQLAKFLSALLRNVGESAQTLALFTHRRDDTVDRLRVGGGKATIRFGLMKIPQTTPASRQAAMPTSRLYAWANDGSLTTRSNSAWAARRAEAPTTLPTATEIARCRPLTVSPQTSRYVCCSVGSVVVGRRRCRLRW